jgi:hypothetical protein
MVPVGQFTGAYEGSREDDLAGEQAMGSGGGQRPQ